MRYQLKLVLDNGVEIQTGFSILNQFLETKTPQQVVDEFYVGTRWYSYQGRPSRTITKAEILDEGTPV